MYIPHYLPEFKDCISKYSHLKKFVEKKVKHIIEHPYSLGEPLKYQLSGLRSCSVKRNFLIIYGILEEIKRTCSEFKFDIGNLRNLPPNTIIFFAFGPHDETYEYMK